MRSSENASLVIFSVIAKRLKRRLRHLVAFLGIAHLPLQFAHSAFLPQLSPHARQQFLVFPGSGKHVIGSLVQPEGPFGGIAAGQQQHARFCIFRGILNRGEHPMNSGVRNPIGQDQSIESALTQDRNSILRRFQCGQFVPRSFQETAQGFANRWVGGDKQDIFLGGGQVDFSSARKKLQTNFRAGAGSLPQKRLDARNKGVGHKKIAPKAENIRT